MPHTSSPVPLRTTLVRTATRVMSAGDELLAAKIERAIRRSTNDKVRNLAVFIAENRVTIDGRCATFYCKQLAQTAAFPLLDSHELTNQIEVW